MKMQEMSGGTALGAVSMDAPEWAILMTVTVTIMCIVVARIYAHYCVDDYYSMTPSRHGCLVRAFIGFVLVTGILVTCLLIVIGVGND